MRNEKHILEYNILKFRLLYHCYLKSKLFSIRYRQKNAFAAIYRNRFEETRLADDPGLIITNGRFIIHTHDMAEAKCSALPDQVY